MEHLPLDGLSQLVGLLLVVIDAVNLFLQQLRRAEVVPDGLCGSLDRQRGQLHQFQEFHVQFRGEEGYFYLVLHKVFVQLTDYHVHVFQQLQDIHTVFRYERVGIETILNATAQVGGILPDGHHGLDIVGKGLGVPLQVISYTIFI